MVFFLTAEESDGELHVRHGEGLQRGHVLPQTGTHATTPQNYLKRQSHEISCTREKLSHIVPVRNKIGFKGIIYTCTFLKITMIIN